MSNQLAYQHRRGQQVVVDEAEFHRLQRIAGAASDKAAAPAISNKLLIGSWVVLAFVAIIATAFFYGQSAAQESGRQAALESQAVIGLAVAEQAQATNRELVAALRAASVSAIDGRASTGQGVAPTTVTTNSTQLRFEAWQKLQAMGLVQ